jgi:hypothetical protein
MNMKILALAVLASLSFSQGSFALPEVPGVIPVSKGTELGVHRIERLVTLKKIDPSFQNQFYAMRAEPTTEGGATYKVYGYVLPDANNQSTTITMLSDKQGAVLSYVVSQKFQSAAPIAWPDQDPLTLMEDALHFVLEGWVQHAEVKPFYLGLTSITLGSEKDAQGNLIAVAKVTSDADAKMLIVRLKADGTFISYEIK